MIPENRMDDLFVVSEDAWYSESGPEDDVVISTRVRLSRNLSGFHFPGRMTADDEEKVRDSVLGVIRKLESPGVFMCRTMGELTPGTRRILLERNLVPQEFTVRAEKGIALRADQRLEVLTNEVDHIRIAAIRGGRQVYQGWREADELDTALEDGLDYAVVFDFGYLNAEPVNCGTGLRASVMLHLPALVETGLIDKALKAVVKLGVSVKGFFGDEAHSLGEMYQIGNQISIGVSEEEIIEKLDTITDQLVHYERKAREELAEKRSIETEDRVFRALGILRNCRMLSSKEAIEHLSSLRLGVAMGLVNIPVARVTGLFFKTQKAHVRRLLGEEENGGDTRNIDQARARMVREALG